MPDRTMMIDGVRIPRFFYGTAWTEDETTRLTALALGQGFRGIDTANQRKHYHEAGVGRGIQEAVKNGLVARDDLFLQTKFTFRRGQDHRLPYEPEAPIPDQVAQSFARSLEHLETDVIDSYVLHGPTSRAGLGPDDWAAWRAMEAIHESDRARFLGISNVNLEQLQSLCKEAQVRPRFVQNRCYAIRGWDHRIRQFCAANGVIYQGFSLLTANRKLMAHQDLIRIAERHSRTVSQIVFRFAMEIGMVTLTGTTDAEHMRDDLDVFGFRLEPKDVAIIEALSVRAGKPGVR
jgi:diketogulonate reductase-like aldo/keto reductase